MQKLGFPFPHPCHSRFPPEDGSAFACHWSRPAPCGTPARPCPSHPSRGVLAVPRVSPPRAVFRLRPLRPPSGHARRCSPPSRQLRRRPCLPPTLPVFDGKDPPARPAPSAPLPHLPPAASSPRASAALQWPWPWRPSRKASARCGIRWRHSPTLVVASQSLRFAGSFARIRPAWNEW